MQTEHIDWRDNQSNLLHRMATEPAGSICNTCNRHKATPSLAKHATLKID